MRVVVKRTNTIGSHKKSAGESRAARAKRPARSAAPEKNKPKKARRSHKTSWLLVAVGGIFLALFAVALTFSWNRWGRFDDAADFQGEWRVHGSTAVIVVDGAFIKLTPEVFYSYELDTRAKTVSFTLGNMKGQGHYRFSPDRSQLFIADGSNFSWVSTALDDVCRMTEELSCALRGKAVQEDADGDNVVVLDFLSDNIQAVPHTGVSVKEETDVLSNGASNANKTDAHGESADTKQSNTKQGNTTDTGAASGSDEKGAGRDDSDNGASSQLPKDAFEVYDASS